MTLFRHALIFGKDFLDLHIPIALLNSGSNTLLTSSEQYYIKTANHLSSYMLYQLINQSKK